MSQTHWRRLKVLAVVPLAMMAAACGGSNDTSEAAASLNDVTDSQLEGVTITVGDFFGDCVDAVGDNTDVTKAHTECEAMRTLNNKFNAENPWGITVNREAGAEWKSYYDAVNASFAAKKPPNVLLMHESNMPDYASRGLLLPLDDAYDAAGIDATDMTEVADGASTIDGKRYSVPLDEHGNLVHLNMDLMAKAKLVDPDGQPILPTSVEELKQQAAQFEKATGKQYIAWANDFNIPYRMFSTFVSQQGEPIVTDDGEVQIDTDQGRTALSTIKDLYDSGIADPQQTYDSSQQAWLTGDVGVLVDGTWVVNQYSQSTDFDYEATDFPTLFDQPAVWANSHNFVIPVQQDADPVKYRAALAYAAFMFENDKAWALGSGHLSVRPSVLESKEYQQAPQRENYVDTADHAALVPQVKGWQGAEDALEQSIEKVWLSGESVDSALSEAQAAVERQLGQ